MKNTLPLLIGGLLAAASLTACASSADAGNQASQTKTTTTETKKESPISKAVTSCHVIGNPNASVGDAGHSLSADGKGEEDVDGLSVDDEACLLTTLHVTDAIITEMDSTTAMMGRQEATWEGYNITWTYHPDNGLDFVITEDS